MGVRSVMIGDDLNVNWPKWIHDINYINISKGIIHTNSEIKDLMDYDKHNKDDIFNKIHKALLEEGFFGQLTEIPYRLVILEETGAVARVVITKDKVEHEIIALIVNTLKLAKERESFCELIGSLTVLPDPKDLIVPQNMYEKQGWRCVLL